MVFFTPCSYICCLPYGWLTSAQLQWVEISIVQYDYLKLGHILPASHHLFLDGIQTTYNCNNIVNCHLNFFRAQGKCEPTNDNLKKHKITPLLFRGRTKCPRINHCSSETGREVSRFLHLQEALFRFSRVVLGIAPYFFRILWNRPRKGHNQKK